MRCVYAALITHTPRCTEEQWSQYLLIWFLKCINCRLIGLCFFKEASKRTNKRARIVLLYFKVDEYIINISID